MDCIDQLMRKFGINRQQAIDIMSQVTEQRNRLEAKIQDIGDIESKLFQTIYDLSQRKYVEALALLLTACPVWQEISQFPDIPCYEIVEMSCI